MAAFALVHSPLMGPNTWAGVAAVLAGEGHDVVVPSLVEATVAGPPFASRSVEAVIAAIDEAVIEGPLVVAGHSGAGPLLPAVGAALGGRVAAHLFVDAALPMPGRSREHDFHPSVRSLLAGLRRPDGHLPPWDEWWGPGTVDAMIPDPERRQLVVAELRAVPYALLEEPLPVVPGWPGAPCAYLRLSDVYAIEEAAASGMGWPVSSLAGSHLELVTAPDRVARAMLTLVERAIGS